MIVKEVSNFTADTLTIFENLSNLEDPTVSKIFEDNFIIEKLSDGDREFLNLIPVWSYINPIKTGG